MNQYTPLFKVTIFEFLITSAACRNYNFCNHLQKILVWICFMSNLPSAKHSIYNYFPAKLFVKRIPHTNVFDRSVLILSAVQTILFQRLNMAFNISQKTTKACIYMTIFIYRTYTNLARRTYLRRIMYIVWTNLKWILILICCTLMLFKKGFGYIANSWPLLISWLITNQFFPFYLASSTCLFHGSHDWKWSFFQQVMVPNFKCMYMVFRSIMILVSHASHVDIA